MGDYWNNSGYYEQREQQRIRELSEQDQAMKDMTAERYETMHRLDEEEAQRNEQALRNRPLPARIRSNSNRGYGSNSSRGNSQRSGNPLKGGCILLAIIIIAVIFLPKLLSSSQSPTIANNTVVEENWGVLVGDSISINKMLTCGNGCHDPLHVRINSIQIDKAHGLLTWDIHFFDPTGSVFQPSFDTFALQDGTSQPFNADKLNMEWSTGSLQAVFALTPTRNVIYTLTVTASYYTKNGSGVVSTDTQSISFESVKMLFNP
jgi:hypothetical protein